MVTCQAAALAKAHQWGQALAGVCCAGVHLQCAYMPGLQKEQKRSVAARLPFTTPMRVDHWRDRFASAATLVATSNIITARSSTLCKGGGARGASGYRRRAAASHGGRRRQSSA